MKTVLLICWLTIIAIVCVGVYAIIWLPLEPGLVIFIGIFVTLIICASFWAGKGEIELRRYGPYRNFLYYKIRTDGYISKIGEIDGNRL